MLVHLIEYTSLLLQADPLAPLVPVIESGQGGIVSLLSLLIKIGLGPVIIFAAYRIFYGESRNGVTIAIVVIILGIVVTAVLDSLA